MPVYQRRTRVEAPLSEVWSLYSGIEGLEAVTPGWMRLHVERIVGPEGEETPDELVAGTKIRLSIQPFGIGPRQRWISRITERSEGEGWARFRDLMEQGPFEFWRHTHQFFADGRETVLVDRVEYELPGGILGDALAPFATIGFEPMFRYRHWKTKELLE